ncbi:MAG: PHB depolymerase family esterase [Rickettsiales bacterium]|nr:alpha/beta hydrolase-fold protein [Pseudomonadota bacterium]MDA0965488.1 alpha/beta hydrolase-fold protein [Pseudomonadota bacterium]MDG4542812.1 PHB depolymerase family esterase [Rickettsiales bacterium]MDG4544740.1 PHB depolymerase family esterase [Rickettsiales bacterium]
MKVLNKIRLIILMSIIPNMVYSADIQQRDYLSYIPSGLPSGGKVPLVMVLHGAYGNAELTMNGTFWNQVANAYKFVVVYPQGTEEASGSNKRTWNAGECCGKAAYDKVDDVAFLMQLIADFTQSYNIDDNKVYILGHSNGGMLGYKFVCEKPGIVKSLVVVSGALMGDSCLDNSSLSVYAIHGASDAFIKPDGNDGTKGIKYNSVQEAEVILEDSGAYFETLILDGVGHYMYEVQREVYDSYSKVLAHLAFLFMLAN